MSPPPPPTATDSTSLNGNPILHAVGAGKGPSIRKPDYAAMDPLEARKELKEKLACAFRIFAKYGFDEGVGKSPPTPN